MCKFKFCRMNNIYLSLRLGFNIIENGPIIYANVVGCVFFGSNLNLGYFVKKCFLSLIGIYIILMIQFIKS